ncbi:hypothetical protein R9C00_10325 [Flammeovirgaceae bacterium SG7u.111]|nr:hypothetical protein [Flammeovirgaceae bacterium SG7u.132]WPO37848.1 hypothetical protein R9C00_10325 [Flammeovirgaceae bacterium SG7u.111]
MLASYGDFAVAAFGIGSRIEFLALAIPMHSGGIISLLVNQQVMKKLTREQAASV